jgi:hypothetical protein
MYNSDPVIIFLWVTTVRSEGGNLKWCATLVLILNYMQRLALCSVHFIFSSALGVHSQVFSLLCDSSAYTSSVDRVKWFHTCVPCLFIYVSSVFTVKRSHFWVTCLFIHPQCRLQSVLTSVWPVCSQILSLDSEVFSLLVICLPVSSGALNANSEAVS